MGAIAVDEPVDGRDGDVFEEGWPLLIVDFMAATRCCAIDGMRVGLFKRVEDDDADGDDVSDEDDDDDAAPLPVVAGFVGEDRVALGEEPALVLPVEFIIRWSVVGVVVDAPVAPSRAAFKARIRSSVDERDGSGFNFVGVEVNCTAESVLADCDRVEVVAWPCAVNS